MIDKDNISPDDKSLLAELTEPEKFWKVKGYGRFVIASGVIIMNIGCFIYILGSMLKRINFAREERRRDGKWYSGDGK